MAAVRPLITSDSVTMTRGITTVLDDVTVAVNEGDRIGVVGLNGGGKSTLLGVLTRSIEPDSGRVTHGRSVEIATVAQRAQSSSASVIQTIVGRKLPTSGPPIPRCGPSLPALTYRSCWMNRPIPSPVANSVGSCSRPH